MVIDYLVSSIMSSYDKLTTILPENLKIIPPLFFIAVTITLYSLFIWFFYRFLARRDMLKLNLAQYNAHKHSGFVKFFAILFYIIEFIIIAPVAIFLWFTVLSIFLIILAKELEVGTVILICAALISAIRITAYFNENLSKDLAKMIPFTLLGITILTPSSINIGTSIGRITQIPLFLNNAIYYLIFIFALEIALRLICLLLDVTGSRKEKE